jgi:hypothetical protein
MKIVYLILTVIPSAILAWVALPKSWLKAAQVRRSIFIFCLVAIVSSGILEYLDVGESEAERVLIPALKQESDARKRADYSKGFQLSTELIRECFNHCCQKRCDGKDYYQFGKDFV